MPLPLLPLTERSAEVRENPSRVRDSGALCEIASRPRPSARSGTLAKVLAL